MRKTEGGEENAVGKRRRGRSRAGGSRVVGAQEGVVAAVLQATTNISPALLPLP